MQTKIKKNVFYYDKIYLFFLVFFHYVLLYLSVCFIGFVACLYKSDMMYIYHSWVHIFVVNLFKTNCIKINFKTMIVFYIFFILSPQSVDRPEWLSICPKLSVYILKLNQCIKDRVYFLLHIPKV